jgi:nitroreductase
MDFLEGLLSRASAVSFPDPGPDDNALRIMLNAAVCAPDHGKLRPWQFIIVRGEARIRLSELFGAALRRREPDAPAVAVEKECSKPLRAPVAVIVVAKVVEGHKIRPIEQVLAAGAAAMNILNAAHALGFGAKWITGQNCYDPWFCAALGLEPADQLVGFLYLGSQPGPPDPSPESSRPEGMSFAVEYGQ